MRRIIRPTNLSPASSTIFAVDPADTETAVYTDRKKKHDSSNRTQKSADRAKSARARVTRVTRVVVAVLNFLLDTAVLEGRMAVRAAFQILMQIRIK